MSSGDPPAPLPQPPIIFINIFIKLTSTLLSQVWRRSEQRRPSKTRSDKGSHPVQTHSCGAALHGVLLCTAQNPQGRTQVVKPGDNQGIREPHHSLSSLAVSWDHQGIQWVLILTALTELLHSLVQSAAPQNEMLYLLLQTSQFTCQICVN